MLMLCFLNVFQKYRGDSIIFSLIKSYFNLTNDFRIFHNINSDFRILIPFLCGLHSNPILSHLGFINTDFRIFPYVNTDFRTHSYFIRIFGIRFLSRLRTFKVKNS